MGSHGRWLFRKSNVRSQLQKVHPRRNERGDGGPRFHGTLPIQQGCTAPGIGVAPGTVDNDTAHASFCATIQSSLYIYEVAVLYIVPTPMIPTDIPLNRVFGNL